MNLLSGIAAAAGVVTKFSFSKRAWAALASPLLPHLAAVLYGLSSGAGGRKGLLGGREPLALEAPALGQRPLDQRLDLGLRDAVLHGAG